MLNSNGMCGIAWFATVQRGLSGPNTLERMTGAIRHRGPDDSGYFRDEFAALSHRRLRIVDRALGHQPLAGEAGDGGIVYGRPGGKLFYDYCDGRLFGFAPEIEALFEHPAISPRFHAAPPPLGEAS